MIRVLLAEGNPLVRVGLRAILNQAPEVQLVGEVTTGAAVQRLSQQLHPDVVLLALRLSIPLVQATLIALRTAAPQARVVVLTAQGEDAVMRRLVALGVAGAVRQDEAPAVLVRAIRTVAQGGTWFSPSVLIALAQRSPGKGATPLTPREQQVLALLATGQRNVDIAKVLGVSIRTVEFHVRNVLGKLGAHSRAEALHNAYQLDLVPPDAPEASSA